MFGEYHVAHLETPSSWDGHSAKTWTYGFHSSNWSSVYFESPLNRHTMTVEYCKNSLGLDAKTCDRGGWGANHVGGMNIVLVDGSVHFLSDTINKGIFHALATRDGAEETDFP